MGKGGCSVFTAEGLKSATQTAQQPSLRPTWALFKPIGSFWLRLGNSTAPFHAYRQPLLYLITIEPGCRHTNKQINLDLKFHNISLDTPLFHKPAAWRNYQGPISRQTGMSSYVHVTITWSTTYGYSFVEERSWIKQ